MLIDGTVFIATSGGVLFGIDATTLDFENAQPEGRFDRRRPRHAGQRDPGH